MPFFSRRNTFLKRRRSSRKGREISPDEILLDSHNIPDFDTDQFEGRLESPISRTALYGITVIMSLILLVFLFQAGKMQIVHGDEYSARSEKNLLRPVPLFAGRGVISDRNGVPLIWNAPSESDISHRAYATTTGLGHILGYVQYPSKDKNGFYYQSDFEGVSGIEKYLNTELQGTNGSRLIEVDARGQIVSENTVRAPDQGKNELLSIDSRVQSALFHNIADIAERVGFGGGAGVIMDVTNGEIIALTSYPEYSSQVMSDRDDTAKIKALLTDKRQPFLNRATDGLYTPGSIVKPYVALGALNEHIIDPSTVLVTTGSISIPNPYDDTKSTLFRDWKNQGSINMRQAIAASSDVYFYTVGGGYKDQKGLGILGIDKYLRLFGFGSADTDSPLMSKAGTIPTPDWKKKTFNEDWYLGDTYHTAIGQYGFQVTLVQIVRGVAAIANGGMLMKPTVIKGDTPRVDSTVDIPQKYFQVVREGMRMSVQGGTSKALDVPYIAIGGKSGTAELGVAKDKVNSWITGFFPYDHPKYAFVVMLESGSVHNLIGAAAAMRQQLDWMNVNTPEYFK
ncbi:MAG: penicillin-binding transpeptidase domain-containing protein [Patescibacteria group bacterium]